MNLDVIGQGNQHVGVIVHETQGGVAATAQHAAYALAASTLARTTSMVVVNAQAVEVVLVSITGCTSTALRGDEGVEAFGVETVFPQSPSEIVPCPTAPAMSNAIGTEVCRRLYLTTSPTPSFIARKPTWGLGVLPKALALVSPQLYQLKVNLFGFALTTMRAEVSTFLQAAKLFRKFDLSASGASFLKINHSAYIVSTSLDKDQC